MIIFITIIIPSTAHQLLPQVFITKVIPKGMNSLLVIVKSFLINHPSNSNSSSDGNIDEDKKGKRE